MHLKSKKLSIWVVACLFLQLLFLSGNAQENGIEDSITMAMMRLNNIDGIENWDVEETHTSITLKSKFLINVSGSAAIVVDADSDTSFQNREQHFSFEIHFLPMNGFEEYRKMFQQRVQITTLLNKDAFDYESDPLSTEEWEKAWQDLQAHPVPTHLSGDAFVYIHSDLDNPELSFETSENLKKCIWMQYQLGFLFSEIYR